MTRLAVIEQNLFFLSQGRDLVRRVDDHVYTTPAEDRPRAAGIGPHLRHCLDFYLSFFRDLDSGRIDYDQRKRESPIETDRVFALETIEQISQKIQLLDSTQVERPIEVLHDPAPSEDSITGWHSSTVARELRFLASHTVHHYALIALILRTHGVEPGEEFGVAPATLAYWKSEPRVASST